MLQLHITNNIPEVVARLAGFNALLQGNLADAMGRSLDDLQTEAQAYMWATFMNPQGPLEDNFGQLISFGSSMEGELYNPTAYAWRREEGFSGMTDSLGRFFPHDPGVNYMSHSLEVQTPVVIQNFADAIGRTIAEIGG